MTWLGWLQIAAVLALALALARGFGAYMTAVFTGKLGRFAAIERVFYRWSGIDPAREQDWAGYAIALLAFNAAGFIVLYGILRLQHLLPLNPQGFGPVAPDLAFNIAVSFVSNTNWQSYAGESTLSHLSQMLGLTVHNFLSAATGIAVALAITRAFARGGAATVGNFWVDQTRATLYVLLPVAVVVALVLVLLGVPQTLDGSVVATTLEGANQTIALGPVASQVSIRQIGTNGGGFFNANGAHPFENPDAWSNLILVLAIIVLPAAVVDTFGRMIGDQRQGWTLLATMWLLMFAGVVVVYAAESAGNPLIAALGVAGPNMEGKEIRFGLAAVALWVVFTTGASNGSVNAMHGALMPLGGLVPMFLIQLGEVLPGGVGSGLYGMVLFAILAVFVAGLMVGRTPEYLGKKIEAREVKLTMLAVLICPALILGFSAVAAVLPAALESLANAGPRGLSEILYAYSSAAGNNGSAFAGLSANTAWYNTTTGIAMLLGRFAIIVPVLAIAGSLARKTKLPASAGTFPTHTPLFVGLLAGVILILGGLQFFPALTLGPIVEHFQMLAGRIW